MEENSYLKVKRIFENYKKNLAKLMRTGQINEVVTLLNDSGMMSAREKSMYDIAKKSLSASSIEEIEIQKVNFVFSLLNRKEKDIILNEFVLARPSMWWADKYSRSTSYRTRQKICQKFVMYYYI